ncbi:hypothetical protein FRB94_003426 [Tulasnella sp. JGI-2019a]|nr:hypothetical protein FRB94_003426 [Tulasnella sp. JGI-2019a]
MAREHHLIKDFTWSTDSPKGSVAGGAAPTDSDASVVLGQYPISFKDNLPNLDASLLYFYTSSCLPPPEVAALPTTSIGIPPLGPVENAPIAAERSEDAVEAMIIFEASSGPTSGKRGRKTSISITGPVEVTADGEWSMKQWKGSV